uniref:Uncharacterized protein n=1 Tax=Setaria italica TaxID=4555 RepID=K3XQC2_SETIT
QEELTECNRDREVSGVFITLHDGANISHLTGTIAGPADSPYEGGTFTIDIRLPGEPPLLFRSLPPPRAFLPSDPPSTRRPRPRAPGIADYYLAILHPNISSQNGAICLDILKDQWSPALTLKTALLSLQALLSSPAPDDPQDAVVAQQAFAKSAPTGMEEKVQKLVEMGFPEDLVRSTLKSVDGDENLALEKLCSG